MAKRFTDTGKWQKSWFTGLSLDARWAWIYLLDNCDNTGVWSSNFSLMSFQIGFQVTEGDLLRWLGDKLIKFDKDKFFIPSFIEFQYGELKDSNNAHRPVIKFLEKNKLHLVSEGASQDLQAPSVDPIGSSKEDLEGPHRRPKDKEQDKDKDKVSFNSSKCFNPATWLKTAQEKSVDEILPSAKSANITPDDVVELFNKHLAGVGSLKHCRGLGAKDLKECLNTFSHLPNTQAWVELFERVKTNSTLNGSGKTVFLASLDWLVKEENALKVLSGKYDIPSQGDVTSSSVDDLVKRAIG